MNMSTGDTRTIRQCQDASSRAALTISSSRLPARSCFQIRGGPCLWCPGQVILAGLGLAPCQGIARPWDQGTMIFVFLPCSTSLKIKIRRRFLPFSNQMKTSKTPTQITHETLWGISDFAFHSAFLVYFPFLWKYCHLCQQTLAKSNQLWNPCRAVFKQHSSHVTLPDKTLRLLQFKNHWTQGPGVKCGSTLLLRDK